MQRDEFMCRLCCDNKTTLNVHHKEYINGADPWEYSNESLITVCEHCHFTLEVVKSLNNGEVDFEDIKIFKLKLEGGIRTMFTGVKNKFCIISNYDENDELINGIRIEYNLYEVAMILKFACNGEEIY